MGRTIRWKKMRYGKDEGGIERIRYSSVAMCLFRSGEGN